MAFLDDEQSKHAGRPVELFKYEGTYDNYFYTSGPAEVSYGGDVYVPIATKRSALNVQTQNDDNSEVTIELPVSSQLIAVYGFQIAPPDLKLTIYRGHNGDFVRAWSGNVENIQVVKGTASVRVPSDLAAALNADFPNVYYQGPCNHALFDARCGVPYEDWSFETEVAGIVGLMVTLDGIGTLDGQLVGGDAVLASGERRMIIAQAGNVITVNYPFAQIAINDVITIAAGCDLAWAGDCATRFNNQERNGGFPFIPPKNIFSTGLEPGKDVSDIPCSPYVPTFEGWYLMFRQFIYAPVPPLASNSRGTTLLTFGTAADFNSQPCTAYGTGGLSICNFNDATGTWREYRYDGDVLAAISGSSIHLQHQYAFNVHETNARMKLQYRRWFDEGWTTIMNPTGDGVDATTAIDGSVDLDDLFPRDNYWTVPF